jgi:hypothetical protein
MVASTLTGYPSIPILLDLSHARPSQPESIDPMLPSKELFDRQDIATAGFIEYSARKTLHLKHREPAASPITE